MQEKTDNFFQIYGFSIRKGQVYRSKPISFFNTKDTKTVCHNCCISASDRPVAWTITSIETPSCFKFRAVCSLTILVD